MRPLEERTLMTNRKPQDQGLLMATKSVSHWLDVLKTTETADRWWKKAVKALASMGLQAVPALIEATGDR